jgi:Ala-tRNA(Pro) deacylase
MQDMEQQIPQVVADFLQQHDLPCQVVFHPPVHTVEEAMPYWEQLPGLHTKNLFLKDAKGKLFVVTCLAGRSLDMKKLPELLNSKKLSFGKPELMQDCLHTQPGALGPLSLLADTTHQVTFAIDEALWNADFVTCHPMVNTCTVSMAVTDLKAALAHMGVQPVVLALAPEGQEAA